MVTIPAFRVVIEENIPLASYTTLGVGGPARFLIRPKSEEQLIEAVEFAEKSRLPVLVLGGGSNVVVSDSGFPGVVIKIELSGIESIDHEEGVVTAAAGEEWDSFVRHCVDHNLAGLECLSGIPGTVGGTPVQNVGAYGQEVGGVIRGLRALDRLTGEVCCLPGPACGFGYRTSIFNTICRDRYIVTRVDFVLQKNGGPQIRYQDLLRQLSHTAQGATIRDVREAVLQIRKSKGMVLSEQDPDSKSAGSFFKNPVLTLQETANVEERTRAAGLLAPGEAIPHFPAEPGKNKIAAAWLIEHAGFSKGYISGNAGISGKHSLALINRGGATAQEILELMRSIQARIRELFGVELQPEPVFIGFD